MIQDALSPLLPSGIVFMGSDPMGLGVLNFLKARLGSQLLGVWTQPDRPRGRGQQTQAGPIKQWALDQNVPVYQPEKGAPGALEWVHAQQPALGIVMAYGQILPQRLLEAFPLGVINLHTSLLPLYRGASPIESAIAAGHPFTGVSLMQLVRQMDAGPVLDFERIPIGPEDTAVSVRQAFAQAMPALLARNLESILTGAAVFHPQTPAADLGTAQAGGTVSYARMLCKQDGFLDFHRPAVVLERRIRALCAWPGCFIETGEGVRLKVGPASAGLESPWGPIPESTHPGTLLGTDAQGLWLSTTQGALCLHALQRPGGRMLSVEDFLRGFPMPAGSVVRSGPMKDFYGPDWGVLKADFQMLKAGEGPRVPPV